MSDVLGLILHQRVCWPVSRTIWESTRTIFQNAIDAMTPVDTCTSMFAYCAEQNGRVLRENVY